MWFFIHICIQLTLLIVKTFCVAFLTKLIECPREKKTFKKIEISRATEKDSMQFVKEQRQKCAFYMKKKHIYDIVFYTNIIIHLWEKKQLM